VVRWINRERGNIRKTQELKGDNGGREKAAPNDPQVEGTKSRTAEDQVNDGVPSLEGGG